MPQNETRQQKRERMFHMIETYHSGGQSQKDFCHTHNLSRSTFHYWLRKYRKHHNSDANFHPVPSGKKFIPLNFSSVSPAVSGAAESVTIEYPNGVRLSLQSRPDISFLRALITLAAD